jgi:hypothetical protein
MALRARAIIICDDIRYEVGNKLTLVGVYNETIGFPPGEGAFGIPKLAALFMMTGLRGQHEVKYRSYFKGTSLSTPVPPMRAMPRPQPDLDEHNFILQLVPAMFNAPGKLTVVLEVEISGATRSFEHSVSVIRGGSPPIPEPPAN